MQQPPPSGIRATIDRVLPPFSAQRYVAIWLVVTAVIVGVFLILLRPWASSEPASLPAATSGAGKFMTIETSKGRIVARLHTDPSAGVGNTIANFEQKAQAGYFDGLIFHRVEDWVIQGGDPLGTGTGGGTMPSEYNQLTFKAGSLGIARGEDPTLNNDSQFFITKTPANWLDGQYTNWGEVVEGMDVVNQIAIGDKINRVAIETR